MFLWIQHHPSGRDVGGPVQPLTGAWEIWGQAGCRGSTGRDRRIYGSGGGRGRRGAGGHHGGIDALGCCAGEATGRCEHAGDC
ncbi:MAG: hypothetical protein QXX08_06370, partial [Candidatus Bathyarchaeia archaeon]